MLAAPASWAAGTNRTPPATKALVRWKLPLPTRPNACRVPPAASRRPTSSATRTSALHEREHPAGAAGATDDRQRRGEHQRAGDRQPGQVLQLGQAVLVVAEQVRVA